MKEQQNAFVKTERRDAAENRQRILKVALELFEQHGVEQVSMNQIAKETGIGPATLYRRYSNKGELCLDLIKNSIDIFFVEIGAFLEEQQHAPADQRLKEILKIFIQFKENKAHLLKGVEDSMSQNKSLLASPLYDELHRLFISLYKEMHSGNIVFKADMLLRAFTTDAYLFQREVRGLSPEEILEQLCATFLG
ncbi:TetR/AcrR family transcriptional regulator [Paenibacillus wynnii]|uniref:TetR family transcriptional regulator n=1 Tax=Paenibacillus wynnii TaxID=268407 RepID=A0A098M8F3_9BACL|nr:TetR/AcrR family transcriptional regulator [Paenibacillus wynnii]KGE18834.1 TetR family transcriptional regulator [Paenibacillus wynnii]